MTDTDAPNQIIYMDAVLVPNQSLSPKAVALVMAGIGALSFISGLAFYAVGAWPVIGFFGLDLLGLYVAFRWINRQQRQQTRITITADTIRIHHFAADNSEKTAEIPSAFARVELDTPVTHNSWLRIEHGQTAWVIGRFLTPKERGSLAKTLRAALANARAERFPA